MNPHGPSAVHALSKVFGAPKGAPFYAQKLAGHVVKSQVKGANRQARHHAAPHHHHVVAKHLARRHSQRTLAAFHHELS
jgi:hypothetical protein